MDFYGVNKSNKVSLYISKNDILIYELFLKSWNNYFNVLGITP